MDNRRAPQVQAGAGDSLCDRLRNGPLHVKEKNSEELTPYLGRDGITHRFQVRGDLPTRVERADQRRGE